MADAPVQPEKMVQTHADVERERRLAREAEALRENLRKRKQQGRKRREVEVGERD